MRASFPSSVVIIFLAKSNVQYAGTITDIGDRIGIDEPVTFGLMFMRKIWISFRVYSK